MYRYLLIESFLYSQETLEGASKHDLEKLIEQNM